VRGLPRRLTRPHPVEVAALDATSVPVVAPLDRDAVRRVLRRAVELEGRDERQLATLDSVDAEAVVAAAAEVGIPEHAVRRSLAMERLGPLPRQAPGLLGPAVVVVETELPGSAADALARFDAWLVSGHHLRRDRLRDGAGSWSRRPGLVGSTFRSLRKVTGEGYLGDLERIDVVAVDSGTGTCLARVAADRRRERRVRGAAGAAVATVTTAGAVVGALALGPLVLLALPATVASGAGVAVGGRSSARRLADELGRVVGCVEGGVRPTRLAPDLAKRVVPTLRLRRGR
jgi:hypothetical protein